MNGDGGGEVAQGDGLFKRRARAQRQRAGGEEAVARADDVDRRRHRHAGREACLLVREAHGAHRAEGDDDVAARHLPQALRHGQIVFRRHGRGREAGGAGRLQFIGFDDTAGKGRDVIAAVDHDLLARRGHGAQRLAQARGNDASGELVGNDDHVRILRGLCKRGEQRFLRGPRGRFCIFKVDARVLIADVAMATAIGLDIGGRHALLRGHQSVRGQGAGGHALANDAVPPVAPQKRHRQYIRAQSAHIVHHIARAAQGIALLDDRQVIMRRFPGQRGAAHIRDPIHIQAHIANGDRPHALKPRQQRLEAFRRQSNAAHVCFLLLFFYLLLFPLRHERQRAVEYLARHQRQRARHHRAGTERGTAHGHAAAVRSEHARANALL